MQIFGYTIIKTELLEQLKADLEKARETTDKLEEAEGETRRPTKETHTTLHRLPVPQSSRKR